MAPKDICTDRIKGTRKARDIVIHDRYHYRMLAIKSNGLKCFYSCESRGTTDEASVMDVEEQPQVCYENLINILKTMQGSCKKMGNHSEKGVYHYANTISILGVLRYDQIIRQSL